MKTHYPGLDGIRGVAAFAVMAMHEVGIFLPGAGPIVHASPAVDLFFMLSGFVLAFAYDARLDGGMTWRDFMIVRLIRLYPLLLFSIGLTAALTLGKGLFQHVSEPGYDLALLPAAIFLLPVGPFAMPHQAFRSVVDLIPFVGPGWSLFFEILGGAAFATRMRQLKGGMAWLLLVLSSIMLIILIFAAGGVGPLGQQGYLGAPGGIFRFAVPFIIGIVLFRKNISNMFFRIPIGFTLASAGVLLMLPIENTVIFDVVCIFIAFPILVCLGSQETKIFYIKNTCVFLGKISYPLYLLHIPISRMVGFVLKVVYPAASGELLIAVSMASSVVSAIIVLRVFDEPVRRWLNDRFRSIVLARRSSMAAS